MRALFLAAVLGIASLGLIAVAPQKAEAARHWRGGWYGGYPAYGAYYWRGGSHWRGASHYWYPGWGAYYYPSYYSYGYYGAMPYYYPSYTYGYYGYWPYSTYYYSPAYYGLWP